MDLRVTHGLEITRWAHPDVFIQDWVVGKDTHASQVVPDVAANVGQGCESSLRGSRYSAYLSH